jgi:hypothetical protein
MGSPASHPAIDGPHHLPDIETISKKSGTKVSFSASMEAGILKNGVYLVRAAMVASMSFRLSDGGFGPPSSSHAS